MNKAYLGLGTNIENRETHLRVALTEISQLGSITKQSSIYETSPVGYEAQDDFLNMVIELETELDPTELIIKLQEIEHKIGRIKEVTNGPRKIDIDILLFNNEVIDSKNLTIPHPRMHRRKFVLIPLKEIKADLTLPTTGESINTLLENLKNSEKVNIWITKK